MRSIKDKRKLLEYYMSLPYTIKLVREEDGYFVEIEELKGCMSGGDTIEEAIKNIEEAKEAWLETAIEKGIDVPLPESMREYSGRFVVRVPRSLHKKLVELAKEEGVSLNQLVVHLLSERLTVKHLENKIYGVLEEMKWNISALNYRLQMKEREVPEEVKEWKIEKPEAV